MAIGRGVIVTLRIPRYLIVGLAAVFSIYIVLLGVLSLSATTRPILYLTALGLFVLTVAADLWPGRDLRMPWWLGFANLTVTVSLPVAVSAGLDPGRVGNDYSTWYVAAVGVLMVMTSTRRRQVFAWLGIAWLVVHTLVWAGPGALAAIGVVGSAIWVGLSHAVAQSLERAAAESQEFVVAGREAAQWQAAQEAHLFERQFRLRQTMRMALPMLRKIVTTRGALSEAERVECAILEAAIRDEIRGRRLLNDAMRREVMAARRRGTVVSLLDEGDVDDVEASILEPILDEIAAAIHGSAAGRIIVRTAPEHTGLAVTVVGLADAAEDRGLGHDGEEEGDVDLWLEIPRPSAVDRVPA